MLIIIPKKTFGYFNIRKFRSERPGTCFAEVPVCPEGKEGCSIPLEDFRKDDKLIECCQDMLRTIQSIPKVYAEPIIEQQRKEQRNLLWLLLGLGAIMLFAGLKGEQIVVE